MATDLREDPTPALLSDPSRRLFASVWTMACLVGILAGWAAAPVDATWLNLPVAVWAFLVVWASTTAYLAYRRHPAGVAARGLALAAAVIVVVPLTQFLPDLLAAGSGSLDWDGLAANLYGLLTFQTAAVLTALGAVALSRRLRDRAASRRRRRAERDLHRYR